MASDIKLDGDSVLVDGTLKVDKIAANAANSVFVQNLTTTVLRGGSFMNEDMILCRTDNLVLKSNNTEVKDPKLGFALAHDSKKDTLTINRGQGYSGGVFVEGELHVTSLLAPHRFEAKLPAGGTTPVFTTVDLVKLVFELQDRVHKLEEKLSDKPPNQGLGGKLPPGGGLGPGTPFPKPVK